MAHFDTNVQIKREHFELFQYPRMETFSSSICNNGSMHPDYVCLGSGCFVCERAAIQALPENANWKKKVQRSLLAYQMQHSSDQTLYGGGFNLDSLRRLKPAESEKTKPFYIYDEKLGRKRRHDPWFAKHKVTKDDQQAKRTDQRRKKMKVERDENRQFQPAPFLLDTCIKMESCSSDDFHPSSSPLSSTSSYCEESTPLQGVIPQEGSFDPSTTSNNNNFNNTGDLCINNVLPLLNLNQLDLFPNVHNSNNSCENANSSNDNVQIDLDATEALTGLAHGLGDEYDQWMMGVLAE